MSKTRLFVVAGEESGDVHASNLIKALEKLTPLELYGTGGSRLKQLGQKQYYNIQNMEAIGLDGLLRKYPYLKKAKEDLNSKIREVRPDAVILVDYPGFNLRLAEDIKDTGIPVIYFISPQLWAWNYKRIYKMQQTCTLVLCILPFEEEMFTSVGINAKFIGNPIVNNISLKTENRQEFLDKAGLSGQKPVIGMVPGSRKREVQTLMPIMCTTAKRYADEFDFVIAKAESIDISLIKEHTEGLSVTVAENMTYDVMKHSDLVWVCSGTASLETAILNTPMIIMYKMGMMSYMLYRIIRKKPYIGLPNIMADKFIVPELVQSDLTPGSLGRFTRKVMEQDAQIRNDLKEAVRPFHEQDDPSSAAAEEIYSLLENLDR